MPIYEATRENLFTLIKDFHSINYPTMEVNYPGRWITDLMRVQNPFVGVELDMSSKGISLPATHCRRVRGILFLTHYAREQSGSKLFTDYTDALDGYFGLKTVNGITFYEVNPHNNSGRPGFDGVMNVVDFDIEYFNI